VAQKHIPVSEVNECEKYSQKRELHTVVFPIRILYLAALITFFQDMKSLILGAFYDAFQYNIGDILVYTFVILMTVELIYVMAKYLGGEKKSK